MEIKLNKDSISYYSKVLCIEFSQEETAENIVPDTLPDIATVVDADAMAVLRGKDISDGRLTVNGMVFGYILYRSEEGELRRMPVQLPFSAHWDNSSISQNSRSTVKLTVSSFEGRIINSRKLLLRAEVAVSAEIFHMVTCEYTSGAECEQLELLKETINFSHICAVGERTFNISEDLQLPAGKPQIDSVLKYRAKLCCNEVKAVGSRLVVKGNAALCVIYKAGDGGEFCSADFTIPFSQIYDTDCSNEITAAEAVLMLTGIYLDANETTAEPTSSIKIEIGAVAQFCAWSESQINCLCDAYSTQNEVTMILGSSKLNESKSGAARDEIISLVINTQPSAKGVTDVYTYLGKQRMENGACVWPLSAKVLYEGEDEKMISASGGAEIRTATEAGTHVSAEIGEISGKIISGGIELRIPVKYSIVIEEEIGFATPEELSVDEDCVKDISRQPSIVVIKTDGCTSLWSMAKQFNTTISAINEANPGVCCSIPEKGELLLIAKKR
ncbi:MAG: DUF3794 domain-containing protein [Oscillospiraceae bacterium]|nr:DUF3794 domain-containing protein [Oscillospiraceae bacterium]